jgi:hypothetical protein
MRKSILLFLSVCLASPLFAQLPFNTMDSVNINNINAAVLVHGDMWWNPVTELAHCSFPNGAPTNINFASAIWMSGHDEAGKLHVAAQTYRQDGNDYWPGPLDLADTLTYATSQQWNKIWKVNRTDIQYFQSLPFHDTTNTPQAILTWPGSGNTYARGYEGAPLTLVPAHNYAPFVDLNSNGIYEPLLGEYPDVPGDQALWWIFSDNGPTHTQSNGRPLDIEVHAMAYAYNRGTLIDNVIYYKYDLINESPNTYTDFRIAQWDDIDLGYYFDDFIGFDSAKRMGIAYNGTPVDGHLASDPGNSYGSHIPVVGLTMVSLPGDSGADYAPAGAFTYYNNDVSDIGNPVFDSQFYNYMHAETLGGERFSDDFSDTTGSTGPYVNYVYPDDPSDSGWSECWVNNDPGDRRFILSSNTFTVMPGSVNEIVLALVTTSPDSPGGCPLVNFDSINIVADTAWAVYHHPPPPIPLAVASVAFGAIDIYPNPAHDELYITGPPALYEDTRTLVCNTLGQLMNVPITSANAKTKLDVHELPPGMYYLYYQNGAVQQNAKFTKY